MSTPLDGKPRGKGRDKPAMTEDERLARFASAATRNGRHAPRTAPTAGDRDPAPPSRVERLGQRRSRVTDGDPGRG